MSLVQFQLPLPLQRGTDMDGKQGVDSVLTKQKLAEYFTIEEGHYYLKADVKVPPAVTDGIYLLVYEPNDRVRVVFTRDVYPSPFRVQ